MANLDWLTGLDLSDFGTKKEDGFDWLDDNTISSFNKSIGTQNTGAGTTLAPISSSLPSPKLDIKIEPTKKSNIDTPYIARTGEGTTTMQGVSIEQGIKNWKERDRKEKELQESKKRIQEKEKIINQYGGQEKYEQTFGKFGGPAYNPVLKETPEGIINTDNFDENISKLQDLGISNNKINEIWNSMQTKDPMNPKNWGYFEMKKQVLEGYKDTPIKEMEKSLELGRAMFDYSIGGGLEWAGFEDFGKSLRKGAEASMNNVQFSNPVSDKAFELSDITDLHFWTQSFPALVPFMISTIPIGLGGAMAGTSRATSLGLGTLGEVIGGSVGGALSSRLFESFSEAGGNYADLVSEGYTTEQAGQARGETFLKNMALVFTDVGQFARTFMPIKGSSKLKTLVNLGKVPANAVMEGSEELYQGYIGENAKRKAIGEEPISFSKFIENPEAWRSFTLGAIAGGMFGGVGAIVDQKDIILKELEKNYTNIDNEINKYASEGKDEFIDYINLSVQNGIMSQKFGEAMINQYQERKNGLQEEPQKNLLPIKKFQVEDKSKVMENDFDGETPRFGRSFLEVKVPFEEQVKKGSEFIPADVFEKVAEEYKDLAEGYYYKGKVHLNDNIPENTVYHEVVHYVKDNIDWKTQADLLNEVIKERKITQREVDKFNEIALSQYKTEEEKRNYKPLDLLGYAEEALADGYYMFLQNKPQKWLGQNGKIMTFFKNLFKKSITDDFYKNLNEGKYKSLRYKNEAIRQKLDIEEQKITEGKNQFLLKGEKEKTEVPKKPSITKPSERIKTRKEIKSSEENLGKIAEELKKLSKKVKITDIAELIEKHGEAIMFKALDYGVKKNIFKAEEVKEFKEAIPKITKREDQAPTGRLSPEQRLEIQDMLGYDKLFKKIEEQKIITKEVEEGLKATDSRLHIVNAPETKRVKLPFSLMGNKSATFKQILLPMVKKATEKGAETYVEPFGGAGTVYYFVDDMVTSGIKEFNINHFDNEKYEVIKAIKDGKIKDVRTEVNEAYTTIINDISEILAEIPEAKEIIKAYGLEARGQYFKDIAETFFYPEYAKQFFEERPDTKLAIKGELTTIFKEWLSEHIQEKYKSFGKELTPEENERAVDLILSDTSVFENRYPEISKKIGQVLDKYDGVDFEKGDYKRAMLVAMARHFRQRGDSGQKVVSASNGFQNVIGIKDKMIEGLEVYKDTFDTHGDKINIYNMDGKKFIEEMGKEKNSEKTISYFDPPYIRTTGVYIKNQPKEIQDSLQEYADPTKVNQLFNPLKDTIMMFTNDVNGKYFETLNSMTDRMSKNIIAYKEGTTPTSLLFTKEIEVTPKQVGLNYYSIVKDKFIKDIQKSLEDGLLPTISAQMKKHLAKFEQHIINAYKEKFGDLTKIQDQVYEGKKAFENLQEGLLEITSLKDRQKIISEAKKWLKQNKVTGNDVIKMIDKINKLWIQRQAEIKDIKGLLAEAKKTDTISADIKKELFDFINQNYATKKISSTFQKDIESIDKIENGLEFNENDLGVYEKYLSDRKYNEQINEARKQNIYDLDLDQLHNLRQTISEYIQFGKDSRKYENFQTETIVKNLVKKYGNETKKVKSFQNTTSRILQAQRVKNTGMGKIVDGILNFKEHKSKKLLLDILPPDWVLDEELGIHRLVYETKNEALGRFRDYQEEIRKETTELEKKLKLDKNSKIKITLHGLSKRGDGKGISKIFAYLKTIGDPFTKEPLSMEEIKTRMEEYSKDDFLNKEEKEMYDYMTGKFEEIGNKVRSVKLKVDNQIMRKMDNYFPIKIDIGRNPEKFTGTTEPDVSEKKVDLFRTTEPTSGFTKEATAVELIPELDSQKIFYNHMEKASYYSEMQEQIKVLNEAINKLGSEKLGDLGYGYAKDYVNTLARQGILETNVSQYGRRLAKINRNFQQSVLGYSIQTMLLQTSAIIQAKNVGINLGIQNLPKMDKKTWQMINEKSALMRHREMRLMFGYEGDKLDYGWLDKFNKVGFIPMQFVDTFMTKWMWLNKYNEGIKKGLPEKEAIYEADRDITKALANSHFDGKSNFILKHERGRASFLTMFQTFISYQFANLFYGGGKIREKISGKYGKYIFTAVVLGLIMATYEELLRRGIKKNVYGKETEGGMIESILSNMIGYIPFLNTFYGVSKYGAPATFQGTTDILKGFTEGLEAYQSETKDMTPTKIINLLAGFATLFGIAGTSEAEKWAKKLFGEVKTKKESGGTIGIGDLDLNKLDLNGLGEIPDLGDIDIGGIGDLDLSGL